MANKEPDKNVMTNRKCYKVWRRRKVGGRGGGIAAGDHEGERPHSRGQVAVPRTPIVSVLFAGFTLTQEHYSHHTPG